MREIKFRVWDKFLKVMEQVLVFYHNNHSIYFIHKGTSLERGISNLEVMQFTGLCDKHGKEIYEGDIIRDEAGRIREVKWEGTGWDPFVSDLIDAEKSHKFTIKGNIYEGSTLGKEV